jgi:hypothetical protein
MLVEASQTMNIKLVEVARGVLADARRPNRRPTFEPDPA